jgi:pimeloyl-ACP methyl ester carboxylesterase
MNASVEPSAAPAYPGAVAPERAWSVDSHGVRLHLSEWGDPAAPPVLLCHGMFDHGLGFDTLAPLVATRFRAIALDARGHGDSDWCDAYPWYVDVLDVVNVLRAIGRPAHVVGHSRGGGLATDAAVRAPECVRQLVNIDGFGPPPDGFEIPGAIRPPRTVGQRFADFLEARRAARPADGQSRTYASLDHLIERRRAQNPRLSREWLHHFVFHAARPVDGGWVWKADLRAARGFGPFKPDWIGPSWRTLRAPMLAVIGSEQDTWGPLPESILGPRLSNVARLERATVAGSGHFVHMEQPRATADLLLAWLDA